MLTVLIIRGATLSGAIEGVKFYMGSINLTVLKNPTVRFIKYLKRIFSLIKILFYNLGMERSMYTSFLCIKLL